MPSCLIIGECMVELSPKDPHTLNKRFAGDTFNTAVYLKRNLPDCVVSYVTAVGNDALSQQMIDTMQLEGLDTRYVARSRTHTVGMYLVSTDDSGERSFSYWRSHSAARNLLNLVTLPDTCFDMVYVSGITVAILDVPQREQLLRDLASYRERGACIVFDPNYRPLLWVSEQEARDWITRFYAACDLAFPGGDDHAALFSHSDEHAIVRYLHNLNIDEIVLKRGADNIEIYQQGKHTSVAVNPVDKVVDTTSAGDAFIGGFIAARLAGYTSEVAATMGADVAGVVIGAKGAIVPADYYQSSLSNRTNRNASGEVIAAE
ncbi:sugar kinase [Aestuariibacter sp. GS-14]|uniref:sugar kinase n=1 Tax=Aestuariibacter sp. GS-14 TaxID=2590670 RepID=UPI00112ED022|nr:sugar kinase [Aestuariibacter sp. GS-14]TPV59161.1 sugar kinase [Aestuariibacter sp. GS-14]